MQIQAHLKSWLRKHKIPDAPLIVAVSGGADSVCLLWQLARIGLNVRAVHVNHALRGSESKLDEALVRKHCEQWQVPLVVRAADVRKGSGIEERARKVRLKILSSEASKVGSSYVFLGHHQRDRAETLLMNLSRGAGLRGAGALRTVSQFPGIKDLTLCRPFLDKNPADLKKSNKAGGIKWREDATNKDRRLARNRVRHDVLASLEKAWPGSTGRLAEFSGRAEEASGWIEVQVKRALDWRRAADGSLDLRKFGNDPYLDRLVLLAWIQDIVGGGAGEATLSRLEAGIARGRGKVDLAHGRSASIERGILRKI